MTAIQMDSKSGKGQISAQGVPDLKFKCWIDAFTNATSGLGIPLPYVRWAAIYTISTVLGRHVFSLNAKGATYPNIFVFMVGPPATDKSEIETVIRPFMIDLGIHTAAQHSSKASLIDQLARASVRKITKDVLIDYHYLSILSSEFIQTFPDYDVRFLGMLAYWWDCPPVVTEEKRHLKEPISIPNVGCSILAGVQPGVLAHSFPAEAWNGGFLSRTICVYVSTQVELLLYASKNPNAKVYQNKLAPAIFKDLREDLEKIAAMLGQMVQDESYIDAYLDWRRHGRQPQPKHPKLVYYNLRREHNLEKLSIISAASRGSMIITGEDYLRAREWLETAESNLEDIFVEMGAGDDMVLMQDLHAFIIRMAKGANKPLREAIIRRFLTSRIASQRMDSFLQVAEQAGYISIQAMNGGFRTICAKPSVDIMDAV